MSTFVLKGGFYRFDSKDDYNQFVKNTKEIESATREGHLDRVKSLYTNGVAITHDAMDAATECGHLDIIKYFRAQGRPLSHSILYFSAKTGNIEMMKYARENSADWSRDGEETYIAASLGFLEILQYADQNGCPIHPRAVSIASEHGHLHCVKYMVQLRRCVDSYDIAAILGNLIQNDHLDQIKEQIDRDVWWNEFFCKGRVGLLADNQITYVSFDSYRDIVSYYFNKYPEFSKAIKEKTE